MYEHTSKLWLCQFSAGYSFGVCCNDVTKQLATETDPLYF